MTTTVPLAISLSYLTKQPGAGLPAGPSIFGALATPPATGVEAEADANEKAAALGVVRPNSAALARRTKNIDEIRNFYDSAAILRVPV